MLLWAEKVGIITCYILAKRYNYQMHNVNYNIIPF